MLKIQLVTYLWYDSFLISPFICINLYTFEVYVLKISALKLQKIIKLLIPKHATLISKHPVFVKYVVIMCYGPYVFRLPKCQISNFFYMQSSLMSLELIKVISVLTILLRSLCLTNLTIRFRRITLSLYPSHLIQRY